MTGPIDHAQDERAIGVVGLVLWGLKLGVLLLAAVVALHGWQAVRGLM